MKILKLKGFYARSTLFTLFSLMSAAFSYILYPALVRVLSPLEFGDFAAVMAVIGQTMAILASVNIVSVYLVKSQGENEAKESVEAIQKILLWLFMALATVVILFSPVIGHFLQIRSSLMFLVLSLILVVNIPISLWTGYLQGHKELIRVGAFTVISTLSKLVFAVLLALALGSFGALAGVLVGALVGVLVLKLYPGVKLPTISTSFRRITEKQLSLVSNMRNYILGCVFAVGSLGVMQNIDITFAKVFFKPEIAGLYSGVGIVSNALYYLCFVLVWIVLPEIDVKNKKVNKRVLGTSYKLIAALALSSILLEYLFRNFLTNVLLGENFSGQGSILIFASLYQLTLVSIVLYTFYLLVCRKNRGFLLAGLVFTCGLSFPILSHSTPLMMIQSLWLALLTAVALYGTIRYLYTKSGSVVR